MRSITSKLPPRMLSYGVSSVRRTRLQAVVGGGGEPFDDRTRRALREAAELLSIAQEQATIQATAELMTSWQADAAATPLAESSGISSDTVASEPPSDAALEALMIEQGLRQRDASALVAVLRSDAEFAGLLAPGALAAKLSALARVLPGAPVAALVAEEPQLLLASSNALVSSLVALVAALPGHDVASIVALRPRLLLLQDMPDRVRRVWAKLVALHPSHSPAVVAELVAENPDLLLRMPFYCHDDVRSLDDLPIELQNWMVLGGRGLGFLHKYWNGRLTEPARAQEWDNNSSSAA